MKRTIILGIGICLAVILALLIFSRKADNHPEPTSQVSDTARSVQTNPTQSGKPGTEALARSPLENAAIESIAAALSNKVAEITMERLLLASVRPDTNVTAAIRFVDELGQQLMTANGESENILELNETVLAVLDALKQRRIYKYQLWAEQRLEQVQEQLAKGNLSHSARTAMYLKMGEINPAFISENMLNREIMSTMATIYDGLEAEGKKEVRRLSIQQQADVLSEIGNLPRRMTPDDF